MRNKLIFFLKFVYRNFYMPYFPIKWQWRLKSLMAKRPAVGGGSFLARGVSIVGGANIYVGSNTAIGEYSWLNVNSRTKNEIRIKIGNNSFIGRRNFFSSGRQIIFGDYVLTAADCKFVCATHLSGNPFLPYINSGVSDQDSIKVGTNCFFGVGATVIGNVDVGYGSVVAAHALVLKDVPPFSLVVGNPGKVKKRYSFVRNEWIDIDSFSEGDLAGLPLEADYLSLLQEKNPKIYLPLPAAGSQYGNI